MSDNTRQFSSLDNGDRGMGESLTNRPRTAAPVSKPEDFEKLVEAARRLKQIQQANGTYVERTTAAEQAYEAEQKAARDNAFREAVKQAQADKELNAQREQASRSELLKRIQGEQNQLSPIATESDVNKARRLSGLPAIDDLPPTSAATASRQPTPSTGSPPPTPNGTAARASALVEPTAHPAPAALKEAIGGAVGGIANALPRSLPQAAGRLVIPGVGAALVLGGRLIAGQSLTQAATGTAGTLIGSGVGALVGTAIAGPIGGVVGSMIGGFAGGLFSDWLFGQNLPSTAAHLESNTPNYPAFIGGQEPGAAYQVTYTYSILFNGQQTPTTYHESSVMFGPISAPSLYKDETGMGAVFDAFDYVGNPTKEKTSRGGSGTPLSVSVQSVVYLYGGGRGQESPMNLQNPAPPPDNRPYYLAPSPLGSDTTIPSGTPGAGLNKGKTREIAPSMPSNNTPNGGGAFPGHGGLAPSYLPNPTQTPSNGGGMLPDYAPQPQPMPFLEPQDTPVAREQPRNGVTITQSTGGVIPITYADVTPGTITQSTITRSEGTDALGNYIAPGTQVPASSFSTPTSTPQTVRASPKPDAYSPVPKMQLQPQPKTTEQATTDKTSELIKQQKKDFDDQIGRLTAIATAIAALTPAIQGIPDAIAKSPSVKASTQGAVCEIAQPGGCLGNALDDSANKINQNNNKNTANLLDKINASANAAQLALLELINTKLGDLLPGGLSATFTRLWQTLQVDRVINILTLITTFHNGLMLSNNLAQTLFGAIDNISQASGFKWKNEKGEESGFSSIVSEWTANFFKSIFGEANYTELVAEYKKANRIYQATANIFNALQSIGYSIISALEVVGSYVALIGNALRKWGEVGESAYKWFNPQPNFHNKFFTTLEGVTNVVSQVDQVASEVVSVEQNVAQIGELKNELTKTLGEEDNSKQGRQAPEAAKVKASADASKVVSATGIAISDSDKEADE